MSARTRGWTRYWDGKDGPVDDLHNATDAENNGTNDKRPSSTQPAGNGPYCKTAKESPGLQDADTIGIDLRLLFLRIPKVTLERSKGQDAAHDASIVGEQKRSYGA